MRSLRALILAAGLAAAAPSAFCREQPPAREAAQAGSSVEQREEQESSRLQLWKWANFLVLAGGIGYLAGKNAGPVFSARSRQIRKDMIEADEIRKDAELRLADVEQRLRNLETEIATLRSEAQNEARAETERLTQHTAAEIAKIQQHAGQEIAAAAKAARLELKSYSASLAIGLAEKKIRDRMTPADEDALVRAFIRDVQ